MYKLGRGGGKRALPPPPPSRPATAPAPGRLSIGGGGGRNRPGSAAGGGVPPGKEESFVLESPADLDFGSIIRLTPDLIEEIRRVESQGAPVRIKFAPNSTIPNGNVIDVGGKEFGFTWSRDDLCDIYEECQSGEGGDGLLVERGSAWRKLNVLRTLDESTKKHVKKRSEEAERLLKSRKAIILDPTNPSMKNQVKKMAAAGVEGNMRRMGWKQKKEPFFKKQRVDSAQGPTKPIHKPGPSSNKTTKGLLSTSPMSSPPEQPPPGCAISPIATGISAKGETSFEEITPSLDINKEHIDTGSFNKETPSRSWAKHKVVGHKGRVGDQPVDLKGSQAQKTLGNSKEVNLKALEKGIETIPNAKTKNDNAIKDVEALVFKTRAEEAEHLKRRESACGSPPESEHDIALTMESIFGENIADGSFEQLAQQTSKMEEEDPFEKIDIMLDNPDPFSNADTKISKDIEGKTSSSESGSDSDSESDSSDSESDSGSQSRSRSKSKSPAGSASGSSSDSDSDGSSSSKEGSDIDVDIINSEGEKEEAVPKTEATDLNLFSSPGIRGSDGEQEQIDILGDQEEQLPSLPIDLIDYGRDNLITNPEEDAKDFPSDNSVKISENPEIKPDAHMGSESYRADYRFPVVPFYPHQYKHSEDPQQQFVKSSSNTNERVIKNNVSEKQPVFSDWPAHEKKETTKKNKSKRDSGSEFVKDKTENAKRSKGGKEAEAMPDENSKEGVLLMNSRYVSPKKSWQDQYKSTNDEWIGTKDNESQDYGLADRSRSATFGNTRKIPQSPDFWSSSSVDAEQSVLRIGDVSAKRKSFDISNQNTERMHVRPDTMLKDKMYKGALDEINVGEKPLPLSECNKKSGDSGGHLKANEQPSQIRKSDVNKSPVISAKGAVLRRELSELELGELREPPEGSEPVGFKRQSEGKCSFKPSQNKSGSSDSSYLDISKGRSGSHLLLESKRQSPNDLRGEGHGNEEALCRKMPPDDPVDTARLLQRTMPSQGQQYCIPDNCQEVKSDLDNSAELARRGETATNQGMGLENNSGSLKKNSGVLPPHHDVKNGSQKGYKNARELKQQKPNKLRDSTDRSNNIVPVENETNGQRSGEPSAEDDDSFFAKYDKELPDLRDSIKDFMQYNDYVQEYREKYDCYISLNKNLENIRNDFLKVGEELELAKGRSLEEYYKVVERLKELYHQHGERNKQMKRVFILLHEELKTLKQRIRDFVEMHSRE